MKLHTPFALLLAAGFITLVSSCEKDCRLGVAGAFADRYRPIIDQTFGDLCEMVTQNLFSKISVPTEFSSAVPIDFLQSELIDSACAEILKLNTKFNNALVWLMQRSIFTEEPKFKGDCNHPKRLPYAMPPKGQNWTLEHCAAMDYICGNPPSVCHFLKEIKDRLVTNIRSRLQTNADLQSGSYFRNLVNVLTTRIKSTLSATGHGALIDDTTTKIVEDGVLQNLLRIMQDWIEHSVNEFCTSDDLDSQCNSWDDEIKPLILMWP
ncbi:hypothetical protein BC936DRAFT_144540 [Jimgerdemannia flammicorona]|uniref:Uncharacterized protein n=2 Tax=Jimgerdemannia flammicorona TaxID=994334 RepID=A0A433QH52_9FUNG|nr:hypothetical protein BC936DRAFT_144540 [Jimgerdemannia flammicorona]RUS29074.1 hypothetical protein BC938DRAFT_481090 [Jimgerdemannia flammicorona]